MGMGSLTLACVLLAANAAPDPEVSYWNRQKMGIPIKVEPERRNDVREIVLFTSSDGGATWKEVDHATPDQKMFSFTAPADGKYWFTIQTIDKNGAKAPPDPRNAPVGQKIIVDTTKPVVELKAERKGEEVVASWKVSEDNPNPATFVMEYRLAEAASATWTPIAAFPGAEGNATFKPGSAAVTVRLRVMDMAENEGTGTAEVAGTLPAAPPTTSQPWSQPIPPAPAPQPQILPTTPLPSPQALPSTPIRPSTPTTTMLRGALPPVQFINKPEVKLDFDVTNLGASGLGTVEVYTTADDGATWMPLEIKPGMILPPEIRGPGQARGGVVVRLPEDGKVIGYYLVVKSKANLGKQAPSPGDVPHIRLERDTTPPVADLVSALANPDPSRRDALRIQWVANDKNLSDKPIRLEWAARPDGPWSFIGGPELPNTGFYVWSVPPNAPPNVFIKLTVSDAAGNMTVAQSKEVPVDLSVPEVARVSISSGR